MTKEQTALCGIEQHAVLYALLVREALDNYGAAGDKAVRDAASRYGRERGARMAQRAIANGDELSKPNYALYKEWVAPQEGLMEVGVGQKSPAYITLRYRCEWTESWKRHGLLGYGKMYCRYVDRYLCRGWSEDYEVNITTLLSEGDAMCTFDWGFEMTPEVEAHLAKRRSALGNGHVRDFDYHTGHLLHAMTSEFTEQLGKDAGDAIRKNALAAFEEKFGKACSEAMQQAFP